MTSRGKKTIVHVVGQLDMGGMEKLLVEFARHADRSRFHLHFVCLGRIGVVAEEISSLGWSITGMNRKERLNPWLIIQLARLFHRLRADVVHTHNTGPMLYGCPAARLARAQVIHTRHGQRFGASRRETAIFRQLSKLTRFVVCVSRDSERIAIEEGLSKSRLRTLWNGIDLSRFRPACPEGEGPVVSVGRFSPEKDFANLLRAAAIAFDRDPSFRLEIAGDGICLPELRELWRDLKLDRSVNLLGQVQDIPELMSRASVFTLASLTEGISLTLLEAMASGLPTVATAVGGNPEVVLDGTTGLLVPASNPEALAKALLELWQNPKRRQSMGESGRARVRTHFDVRRMVAEYEQLYAQA